MISKLKAPAKELLVCLKQLCYDMNRNVLSFRPRKEEKMRLFKLMAIAIIIVCFLPVVCHAEPYDIQKIIDEVKIKVSDGAYLLVEKQIKNDINEKLKEPIAQINGLQKNVTVISEKITSQEQNLNNLIAETNKLDEALNKIKRIVTYILLGSIGIMITLFIIERIWRNMRNISRGGNYK